MTWVLMTAGGFVLELVAVVGLARAATRRDESSNPLEGGRA